MKKYLAAAALTAALAQPAAAVTFPSLTTIYVASGVYDSGDVDDVGTATTISCSNVSGLTTTVRLLILSPTGSVVGSISTPLIHGATILASTHGTFLEEVDLGLPAIFGGVLNIESTQSGVFCSAAVVGANGEDGATSLHLVRINGHPGAEE